MATKDAFIALVDDDPSVRCAVERLLAAMGFGVSTFSSAEEFLTARNSDYTCLILDIHLGGMSGLDLSSQLAAAGSDVPVIFISGAADAPELVTANDNRSCTFVHKPIDADLLQGALASIEGCSSQRAVPTSGSERDGSHQGQFRRRAGRTINDAQEIMALSRHLFDAGTSPLWRSGENGAARSGVEAGLA